MSYIIYKTTNTLNGKYYIGVSNGRDPKYLGSGRVLKDAIKEYGREHFVRETLEVFETEEEAYKREAVIVNETVVADRNSYNIGKGGKGGPGQAKSKEHVEAIKRNHLRKSNPGAGRKHLTSKDEFAILIAQHGIEGTAEVLGISKSACLSRYYRVK